MKPRLILFLAGFLFGWGLCISGMIYPAKVKAFLDITGRWDPSLMFVMVGAIGVHALSYHTWLKRKSAAKFCQDLSLPKQRSVTGALLVGSAVFGIGWGLGGYCPGPAIVSLVSGQGDVWIFVGSMIAGLALAKRLRLFRANP